MNIAFDLDGVLINLIPAIQKHLFIMYRADGELIRNNKFKLETKGNLSNNQIWKAIDQAYKDIEAQKPVHGAVALLSALHISTDASIRVITARPESCRLETRLVLNEYFPNIPIDLIMTTGESKLKYLDDIKFFVEDRRKNAIELSTAGKTVFLLNADYNQFDDGNNINVIRLYDLYYLLTHTQSFIRKEKAAA